MFEIQGNGSFMPGEFWFALTILFGTAFVSLLIWLVNRFLIRLDVTITQFKDHMTISIKRHEEADRKFDQHDKQFDKVYKMLEQTVKKK